MKLEEAIARLQDPNIHELVLEPNQLSEWLAELRDTRQMIKELKVLITTSITGLDVNNLYVALGLIKNYEE